MIYVKNDFYSNFNNAVKSNDDPTVQDILIDQLSTVISLKRDDVLELVKKSNIKISKNPTNEELSSVVVKNMRSVKAFRVGLAFLIAKENNILIDKDKQSDIDDKSTDESEEKKINKINPTEAVTTIANTIGVLSDSLKGDGLDKFKAELIEKTNNKAPNYSESSLGKTKIVKKTSAKKSKKWLWIGLGATALIVGYFYAKKKGIIGGSSSMGQDIDINI